MTSMTLKFKSVIFFACTNEKTELFKNRLSSLGYIKIFETPIVDELQQIIDMSEKAVIVVDDDVAANKMFKATINKKMARFKKFYLNWYDSLAKTLGEKLHEQEFSIIYSSDVSVAVERLELYFFGKVNVFNNSRKGTEIEQKPHFKTGYFTHLERNDRKWRVLVSSHEKDDEINKMLGKNWDLYLQNVLIDAADLKAPIEMKIEPAPFHEMVYPHIVDGKVKRLSIVHVRLDDNFVSNLMSIHKFLQTMPLI